MRFCYLICLQWLISPSFCVIFERNAYKGISVAISDRIPETPFLIESLKSLFIRASRTLYNVTGHRAYLGEVNITVPSHWKLPEVKEILKMTDPQWFESAPIRIDDPHPGYGHQPYVLQPFGCGEPGIYIHYTPDYILNHYEDKYGPIEKVFVHEWAHWRYGVFDEYADGNQRSPFFYVGEDKKIHPSNCPKNVKGRMMRPNGETCQLTAHGLPSSECNFYPDPEANKDLKGSLMSFPFLDSVNAFCNETEGEHAEHNFLAPTRHNIMCGGRSVWNVIMSHKDFVNVTKYEVEDTTPVFNIFRYHTFDRRNLIILLDVSAHMAGPKFTSVYNSLIRLVKVWLPDGQHFGLLRFCKQYGPSNDTQPFRYNYTQIVTNVTEIRSGSRDSLSRDFPTRNTGGKTTLGEGFMDALKFVNDSGLHYEETDFLLITDSKTSEGRRVSDISFYVKDSGVRVHSIGLGGNVTRSLPKLCRDTGGTYYHVLEKNDTLITPHDLEVAFMDIAWLGMKNRPQLRGHTVSVKEAVDRSPGFTKGHFYVDSANNVNLTVYFIDLNPERKFNFSVLLQSESYLNTSITLKTSLAFDFVSAKIGRWEYTIVYNGDTPADFVVVTKGYSLLPEFNQLKVQEFRPSTVVNYTTSRTPSVVYAAVTMGNTRPVIRAQVSVKWCTPEGECEAKTLNDDGQGTDNRAWDGIYSGSFAGFTNNGTYSTILSVETTVQSFTINHQRALRVPSNNSGSPSGAPERRNLPVDLQSTNLPPAFSSFDPTMFRTSKSNDSSSFLDERENSLILPWPNVVPVQVEPMVRTTASTAFHVMNFQPQIDIIPPAIVRDLFVTDIELFPHRLQYLIIGLQWTAAGDDLDLGTAQNIEIRCGTNPRLYAATSGSFAITEEHLSFGNLKPLPAGSLHRVKLTIQMQSHEDEADLLFFALRTFDEAGNGAEPSNIATAYLPQVEIYASGPFVNLGAYALGAILGFILLIVFLVIVLKIIQCQRTSQARSGEFSDSSYAQSRSRPTSHVGGSRPPSYHSHLKANRGPRGGQSPSYPNKRSSTLQPGVGQPMEEAVGALISELKEQTGYNARENAAFCASRQSLAMQTLPRKPDKS